MLAFLFKSRTSALVDPDLLPLFRTTVVFCCLVFSFADRCDLA